MLTTGKYQQINIFPLPLKSKTGEVFVVAEKSLCAVCNGNESIFLSATQLPFKLLAVSVFMVLPKSVAEKGSVCVSDTFGGCGKPGRCLKLKTNFQDK